MLLNRHHPREAGRPRNLARTFVLGSMFFTLAASAGTLRGGSGDAGGSRRDPTDTLSLYSFAPLPFATHHDVLRLDFEEGLPAAMSCADASVELAVVEDALNPGNRCLRLHSGRSGGTVTFQPSTFALRPEHFWRLRLRLRANATPAAPREMRLRNTLLHKGEPMRLGRREAFHPATAGWKWVALSDVAIPGAESITFAFTVPPDATVYLDDVSIDTLTPPNWDRRVRPGPAGSVARLPRSEFAGARLEASAAPTSTDGFDTWLPEWVRPSGKAGFFTLGTGLPEGFDVSVAHVFWRDVEPEEGRFDFSPFATAYGKGAGFGVRFKTAEARRWPAWLESRYSLRTFPAMKEGQPVLEPWDPVFISRYEAVYRALKAAGVIDHPELRFWLFGGVSRSLGEENHMGEEDMARFEREGTLTPERFRAWLFGRIDFLAGIFGDQVGKCTLMTTGRGFPGEYGDISTEAFSYALSRGFGLRGGHIENYTQFVGEARIGLTIDYETGRLQVDESNPFMNGRVFYNENEVWTEQRKDAVGLEPEWPYRYRQVIFSSLYQRYQYMGQSAEMLRRFPAINEYYRLTIGKRVDDSPDAFSYLREAFCRPHGRVVNWERWLYQRENPGAVSLPGLMARRTRIGISDAHKIAFDFEGRSTDLERGVYRFDFDVDDRLWRGYAGPVDVFVTYWDDGGSRFALYARARDGLVRTPAAAVGGTPGFRTARFHLRSLDSSNQLFGNSDFSLAVENDCNLLVTLVRVVRAEP